MSTLIQSTVMLSILTILLGFLLVKLKGMTIFNAGIILVLGTFWIAQNLLNVSIMREGGEWKWPILLGAYQLTQFTFRLPLGKLSQKLKSRKIPILVAVSTMTVLSIPMLFTMQYSTFFIATIGLGVFGGTFGMQNQYLSENWNMRNVFITISIITTLFFIGKYVSQVVLYSVDLSVDSSKMILVAFLVTIVTMATIYIVFIKEDKSSIRLDNQESWAKDVSDFKLKHVFILSLMISFAQFAMNMISSNALVGLSDPSLFKVTLWTVSISISLITALVLVKFFDDRRINQASQVIAIIGVILMILSSFSFHSTSISFVGLILVTLGISSYTMSLLGMVLHIDHKNSLLVLGIWLTIKSLSIGLGQITGGEILVADPVNYKYVLIPALIILIATFGFEIYAYKYTKPAFDLIEELELNNRHQEIIKK